jgi:hypothetical protein
MTRGKKKTIYYLRGRATVCTQGGKIGNLDNVRG